LTRVLLKADDAINKTAPDKLNSKWAIAMLMAASELKLAAIKAVNVVPRLAPIIKGRAFINRIFFVATKGTNRDVDTELDCIADVIRIPHPKDLAGF
jgi:hypothetical protein